MGELLWRLRRCGIEWQRILSAFCRENKRLALPRRVKRKRAGKRKPPLRFQSADLFFYFLYILSYLPESVFRMLHGAFYIGFLPLSLVRIMSPSWSLPFLMWKASVEKVPRAVSMDTS